MLFHKNHLQAADSHETLYNTYSKIRKYVANLLSTAAVVGALRSNC